MFEAAAGVTTVIGLLAFVAAVFAYWRKATQAAQVKSLEALPDADRVRALSEFLGRYPELTEFKSESRRIEALRLIVEGRRTFVLRLIALFGVIALGGGIAYAHFRESPPPAPAAAVEILGRASARVTELHNMFSERNLEPNPVVMHESRNLGSELAQLSDNDLGWGRQIYRDVVSAEAYSIAAMSANKPEDILGAARDAQAVAERGLRGVDAIKGKDAAAPGINQLHEYFRRSEVDARLGYFLALSFAIQASSSDDKDREELAKAVVKAWRGRVAGKKIATDFPAENNRYLGPFIH